MLRKVSTLALTLVLLPLLAMGQSTGKLAGRVVDRTTNEPLPGATIVVEGTQLGTAANANGDYFIIGVPVGTFDVRASFVGFESTVIRGVEINAGYTRELNFELSEDVAALDELVVEYERPLIQKDAIGVPKVVTGEEIQNLPVRGIGNVAALQGGVVNNEGSGNLHARGGREEEVVFFVDGVKVIGAAAVPQQAIQEQEMLIGSLPAKYGDVLSGVISVTTKSGGRNFFGSIEAITSEVLDPFGYNLGSVSVGGPIGNKLSFFAAAELQDMGDRNARAIDVPVLSTDRLRFIEQNPHSLSFLDENGEQGYVAIPGTLPAGVSFNDVLSELGQVACGGDVQTNCIDSPVPLLSAEVEPLSSYSFDEVQPNYELTRIRLNGNMTFSPTKAISIRATGRYQDLDQTLRSVGRRVYDYDRFRNDEQTTWGFGTSWTHRLSNSTFYQVQLDYTNFERFIYDPGVSDGDVRDYLFLGDVDPNVNPITARYRQYNSADSTYLARFRDGEQPSASGVFGVLALPGAPTQDYQHFDDTQFRIGASATTQLGLHQIEFGGEFETRTERFYHVSLFRSGVPVGLARYYNDGDVEAGADQGVDRWEDLPYLGALRGITRYWGYDYLGLTETDEENVTQFANFENQNTKPYSPTYYAGYIQDKIEYRDLVLNIGLRVDVFDDNGLQLKDPFALVPLVRTGDAGVPPAPSNIDDGWAVYFDTGGEVVGFRDFEGQFYDGEGQEVQPRDVVTVGKPQFPEGKGARLDPDTFQDYDPEVTWMPRVGVSFPVTDQALFFAHYDKTSQRPFEREHEGLNQLTLALESGQTRAQAIGLRPVTTTEYELGFRQRLSARSAFTMSGFYKKIDGLIQVFQTFNAFPSGFQWYRNSDFGTVKGVELEFDLRRTAGVALNANYTLSFAEGTGSDGRTATNIQWRGNSLDQFPNFINPLDFDRRHSINLNVDYRLGKGEGPKVGGASILENFGVNVVASLRSGQPYTAEQGPTEWWSGFNKPPAGGINGDNLPWSTLVNLRVDRRFELTEGISMTAFLWIQNLINADNVLAVYPFTGLPDRDGWLETQDGRDWLEARSVPVNANAVYGYAADDSFNYGIPRLTRLGLRLNF